jgi:hypothetical protein
MASIKITTVKCIRKQDIAGSDEIELYIAGQRVWEGKFEKGEPLQPNVSRNFNGTVAVELKERDSNSVKSLGNWTVNQVPTQPGNSPLTATAAGYHYEVWFDVN